mgnify:CR=1 FL=1
MKLGKLFKKLAPVALGAFAPGIMAGMPALAGLSPFAQRAIASGGIGLLTGQKPKDAIISGLLGGAAGGITDAMFPGTAAAAPTGQQNIPAVSGGRIIDELGAMGPDGAPFAAKTTGGAGFGGFTGKALGSEAKTMSGELLKSLNLAGEEEGSLLFKLLNTQMGEGLAAGLLAEALASEEEEPQSEFQRRGFGEGYGGQQLAGGQLGGINYANGGEAYFPRRNGGIDPSEGSGKKDDVPAMLMAGEFVMTRDAVKGMGNGDLRKGIGRMYDMMDNLERIA